MEFSGLGQTVFMKYDEQKRNYIEIKIKKSQIYKFYNI